MCQFAIFILHMSMLIPHFGIYIENKKENSDKQYINLAMVVINIAMLIMYVITDFIIK